MRKLYSCTIILISLCLLSGCATSVKSNATYFEKGLSRRMPAKRSGKYGYLEFFYATNRQEDTKRSVPPDHLCYTKELDDNLHYGQFTARVRYRIKPANTTPEYLKSSKLVRIASTTQESKDMFFKQLKAAVDSSPNKSLLIIVFGFRDNFELTNIKTAYFSYLLDMNTPILLFAWPSDQKEGLLLRGSNPKSYIKAREMADASGKDLADLIIKIELEIKPENFWIKASSLGCQVVAEAFHHAYHSYVKNPDNIQHRIDHVIFAAPDVPEDEFDERFSKEMRALSRHLTGYVTVGDKALAMSTFLTGSRRIGSLNYKESDLTEKQFKTMESLLDLKAYNDESVSVIDMTLINDSAYKHAYYMETPEFFDDLYMRLLGEPVEANRRLYPVTTNEKGATFYVLTGSD